MIKESKHVTPLFQLGCFGMASCFLVAIFYGPFKHGEVYEKGASLKPYDHLTSGAPIKVGLIINHFMDSDILKNNVGFEGTLWFAYDPVKVTRKEIAQFSFDEATCTTVQTSYIKKDTLEIAIFDIQVQAKMDFNFKEYPLDAHRICFSLKNNALPVEKYYFDAASESFTLGARAQIHNCTSRFMNVASGYSKQKISFDDKKYFVPSSRVLFSFECNPIDMRHFLNIFLPLYLIFFLTLFSFSFLYAEHLTDVPGIAAAGVPALFAYRFVIESLAPNVHYFMLSDYLFFLYLVLCLLTFLALSWALNYSVQAKKKIIIGLYALMLVGCAAIVHIL